MSVRRGKITHVAIRFRGIVYSLPQPNRHHHVIRFIIDTTGISSVDVGDHDQGFLDEGGKYLTRRQALGIARLYGQVKDPARVRAGQLTSEDLW